MWLYQQLPVNACLKFDYVLLLKLEGPGSVWILVSQGLCCCLLPCQLLPVAASSELLKVVVQCGNFRPGNRAETSLAKILMQGPLDVLLYGFLVAQHMQIFNLMFNSVLWA